MVLERFDENLSFFKLRDVFNASCYSKFPDFENLYNLVTIKKGSCDDTPCVGKAKTNFRLRFNNFKSKHQFFKEEKGMYHGNVFIHTIFKIAKEILMIAK